MNLDLMIKRGQFPWRPRPEATELDVWHEYEIPLTGTFRLGGQPVLFTQVLESSHGLSAWAYVCLEPEEGDEASMITFASTDEMREFVEAKFRGREAVLTLARDDRIIDQWTRSRVKEDLSSTFEDFLNGIIRSVNEVSDPEQRIRAKFAGLEAAGSELAPA
ncbi:hypothetical protein AB0G15_27370 [Streptosporangium sp. NPDC023825]|uniref:hypothetical protein n=1 Tax=Streptosporangium sp. NPDC023825 TaxID=3154909 RepID=UPI00343655E0